MFALKNGTYAWITYVATGYPHEGETPVIAQWLHNQWWLAGAEEGVDPRYEAVTVLQVIPEYTPIPFAILPPLDDLDRHIGAGSDFWPDGPIDLGGES